MLALFEAKLQQQKEEKKWQAIIAFSKISA